jgi:hypothetical protein
LPGHAFTDEEKARGEALLGIHVDESVRLPDNWPESRTAFFSMPSRKSLKSGSGIVISARGTEPALCPRS